VQIAKQMIAHAGLTDRVVHVVKPLDQAVEVRKGCFSQLGTRQCSSSSSSRTADLAMLVLL
jgi:hypothetical protein